jgi:hypothetical protein
VKRGGAVYPLLLACALLAVLVIARDVLDRKTCTNARYSGCSGYFFKMKTSIPVNCAMAMSPQIHRACECTYAALSNRAIYLFHISGSGVYSTRSRKRVCNPVGFNKTFE